MWRIFLVFLSESDKIELLNYFAIYMDEYAIPKKHKM